MTGVIIQHRTVRSSALILVPVLSIPIPNARPCRVCQIPHLVKTVHLSLSPTGSAIVSVGVLDLLKKAGMVGTTFDVTGSTDTPPPIIVGDPKKPRQVQDHKTYSQQIWRPHERLAG
jgi:hypothetical protein